MKKLSIHFVELRKPGEVRHIRVHLYDVVEARPGGFQNCPNVCKGLAHLVGEGVGHGTSLWIYGPLPRDEHKAVSNNGVRVRAGWFRSTPGSYSPSHTFLLHDEVFPARSPDRPCPSLPRAPGRTLR